MKIAICLDECGTEVGVEVDSTDQIPAEYHFKYFETVSPREAAEHRLAMSDDRDDYDY